MLNVRAYFETPVCLRSVTDDGAVHVLPAGRVVAQPMAGVFTARWVSRSRYDYSSLSRSSSHAAVRVRGFCFVRTRSKPFNTSKLAPSGSIRTSCARRSAETRRLSPDDRLGILFCLIGALCRSVQQKLSKSLSAHLEKLIQS